MMNGVSKGLLVLAALVPAVSQAQQPTPLPELSYNYAELSYDESDFDLDSDNVDGDGLTLSGSFELTEDWHAYAAYSTSDLDDGIDVDGWAIGAGYRYPLQDNVDIYGRVLYINREVDGPGPCRRRGRRPRAASAYPHARQRSVRGRGRHSAPRRRRQRHGAAGERPLPLHAELLGRHRPDVRRRYRQPRDQRALHVLTRWFARAALLRARLINRCAADTRG